MTQPAVSSAALSVRRRTDGIERRVEDAMRRTPETQIP